MGDCRDRTIHDILRQKENPVQQLPSPQKSMIPPPPPRPSALVSAKDVGVTSAASVITPGGTCLSEPYLSVLEESQKAVHDFLCMKRLFEADKHGYVFVFSCYPVHPVIQSGPTCGMVALAMASELAGDNVVTTEAILSEAINREFSVCGEMFSASAMQELASHFLPCKTECVHLLDSRTSGYHLGRELVEQLLRRNLVLVPYDADRDHAPCQKLGHKAHWALLTGFLIAFKASDVSEILLTQCQREPSISDVHYWPINSDAALCKQLADLLWEKSAEFFVLGHHGKCRYAGLWPLKDLCLSNANLIQVAPERTSGMYWLPPGGIDAGLRSQAVIIYTQPET